MRAASALLLLALLVPSPARAATTYVRGPYLQDLSSRRVAVLAELDAPHGASLDVVRAGATTKKHVDSTSKDTTHELVVDGLEPATTYDWTFAVDDGTTEKGTFTTAPEDDRPFTFLLYGDNRTNPYAHGTLVEQMRKLPSAFLVNTGDMVYDGSQAAEWKTFFAIERNILRERCLFPTIGNHEIAMPTSDGALRYARVFRVPAPIESAERWYTFRWGSARFFVLDAQDDFSTTERAWLEKTLAEADAEQGVIWRFVVLHHGPYSSGLHGGNESMIVGRVPELLRAHKVDLVLSGHDHDYERGDENGLRYIVSGGGGAPLYREFRGDKRAKRFEPVYHFLSMEVSKTQLAATAIRLDGSTIERCTLAPGGPAAATWACGATGQVPTTAPTTLAQGPASAAPPTPTAPPTPPRRACDCSIVGSGSEWLGLLVAGALVSTAALRRSRNPRSARENGGPNAKRSPDREDRGIIDEDGA